MNQALDATPAPTDEANDWLLGVMEGIGTDDPSEAVLALRAVMHALRHALPVASAASLAAQVPSFVRRLLYEGSPPSHRPPLRTLTARDFLSLVDRELPRTTELHPERAIRAVLAVLRRRLEPQEASKIVRLLPRSLHGLAARLEPQST